MEKQEKTQRKVLENNGWENNRKKEKKVGENKEMRKTKRKSVRK